MNWWIIEVDKESCLSAFSVEKHALRGTGCWITLKVFTSGMLSHTPAQYVASPRRRGKAQSNIVKPATPQLDTVCLRNDISVTNGGDW